MRNIISEEGDICNKLSVSVSGQEDMTSWEGIIDMDSFDGYAASFEYTLSKLILAGDLQMTCFGFN